MATEWYMGVPWYDRALEAAIVNECATVVSVIARNYREGKGGATAYPDPNNPKAIRVMVSGYGAVLGAQDHVVIGFIQRGEQ